jgi:two-component system, NarL family, sensor histidine kinase UhpB
MDAPIVRPKARMWGIALLILLGSQLLLWTVIGAAERAARPPGLAMRDHVTYTLYDKAGEPISASGALRAERLHYTGYRGEGDPKADYALFNILFTVKDKSVPQAVYIANRELIDEISINGIPAQPDKPLRRLQGEVSAEAALYPLAGRYLQEGVNVLFVKTSAAQLTVTMSPFAVGPAPDIESAYRTRSLLQTDVPIAGVAILLFTIALCLVVNWPHEDRLRMRWLIGFLTVNALSTLLLTLMPAWGMPRIAQFGLLILGNLFLGLSASRYAVLDTGGDGKWPIYATAVCGVLVALAVSATAVLVKDAPFAPYLVAIKTSQLAALLLAITAIFLLIRHTAITGGESWLERLVLIFCLTTFVIDKLAQNLDVFVPFDPQWPISLYWSPIVGPLLGIGMVLSLARQAGEARREVAQSNIILAERLQEQDAELARQYQAQKQMLGRQVMLEERQRIVRDMHDGIGGQLLGLMMQVRSGGVDKVEVEQGLQSSIADLRLIVDSMDSAEEGLAETLRSFEHRVRAQVEAAGIELKFGQDINDAIDLGPRPTLQVLRILQEAVTNAMRHSGASRITVSGTAKLGTGIEISVKDNGSGLPEELRRGRGLTSMETRTRNLGGELSIQGGSDGTSLTLSIPYAAAYG